MLRKKEKTKEGLVEVAQFVRKHAGVFVVALTSPITRRSGGRKPSLASTPQLTRSSALNSGTRSRTSGKSGKPRNWRPRLPSSSLTAELWSAGGASRRIRTSPSWNSSLDRGRRLISLGASEPVGEAARWKTMVCKPQNRACRRLKSSHIHSTLQRGYREGAAGRMGREDAGGRTVQVAGDITTGKALAGGGSSATGVACQREAGSRRGAQPSTPRETTHAWRQARCNPLYLSIA